MCQYQELYFTFVTALVVVPETVSVPARLPPTTLDEKIDSRITVLPYTLAT